MIHARPIDAEGKIQVANAIVVDVRVACLEWAEMWSQKTCLVPAPGSCRDRDHGRQFAPARQLLSGHCRDGRKLDRGQRVMTALNQVASSFMSRLLMRHGADDDVPVGMAGGQRKLLGDPYAADVGLDRLELAAVAGVGFGFRVPCVELAYAARKPQMDDRDIAFDRRGRLRTHPQHLAVTQETENARRTNP